MHKKLLVAHHCSFPFIMILQEDSLKNNILSDPVSFNDLDIWYAIADTQHYSRRKRKNVCETHKTFVCRVGMRLAESVAAIKKRQHGGQACHVVFS